MTAEVQQELGAAITGTSASTGMEEEQTDQVMTLDDPQQEQQPGGDGEGPLEAEGVATTTTSNKQPQKLNGSSGTTDVTTTAADPVVGESRAIPTGSVHSVEVDVDDYDDEGETAQQPLKTSATSATTDENGPIPSTAPATANTATTSNNNSQNRSGVSIISQSEDEQESEEMIVDNTTSSGVQASTDAAVNQASATNATDANATDSPAIIPPDTDNDGMNDESMKDEDIFQYSIPSGSATSETAAATATATTPTGARPLGELASQDSTASDAAQRMTLGELANQDSESSVDFDAVMKEAPVILPMAAATTNTNKIQPKQAFRQAPPIRSISEDESQQDLEISDRLLRVEYERDQSHSSLPSQINNTSLASIRDGDEDAASVGGSSVAHSISSMPGTQQAVHRASQRVLKNSSGTGTATGASAPGGSVKRSNSFKVNRMWQGIKKKINVMSAIKKKPSKSKSPPRKRSGGGGGSGSGNHSHRCDDYSEGATSAASVPIPKTTTMAAAATAVNSRGRDKSSTGNNPTQPQQQQQPAAYRRVHTSPGPAPRHSSPVRNRLTKFAASSNDATHSQQSGGGGRRGKGLPSRAMNRSKSEGEFLATARNNNREQLQANHNAPSTEQLKELETIGRALKDGLTYCTMPDRLNKKITYNKCFSGSAAVDFLSIYTRKSRESALQVGRELAEQFGLFVALGATKFTSTDSIFQSTTVGSGSSYSFLLQDSRSAFYRMVAFLPNEVKRMNMMTKVRVFEEGVKVKTRRQGLRKHKKCFVGAEAVQFLVRSRIVKTRAEAVDLGRKFVRQFNLFEPVLRDHEFEDSRNKLYRFVDKRNRYFSIDNMLSTRMIAMGREESDISGADIDDDDEKDNDDAGSSLMSNSEDSKEFDKFAQDEDDEDDEDAIDAEHHRLTEVAEILERGIKVSDNSKRATSKKGVSYKDTFIAARAVTFMVTCGLANNRQEAAALGRRLEREFNLFTEATGKHDFSDSNYYFQFTDKKDRFARPVKAELPLREVAARFEQGVKVKDHTYRLKSYKNTFMGSSAVDFLVNTHIATSRSQAVRLGCQLAGKYNLFEKVTGDREFSDDQVFFRFTPLNQRKVPEEETPQYKKKRRAGRAFLLDRSEASRASLVPTHVTEEMLAIAENFLNGVKIKEHKFRAKAYRGTFVGSEAVSFMVNSSLAKSRKDAVDLGKKLTAEVGLFLQIDGKKEFKDDYLLYRFSEKFERQLIGDEKKETPLRGLMSNVSGLGTINLKSLPLEKIAEAFRNGMKGRSDDQSEASEAQRRSAGADLLSSTGQIFKKSSDKTGKTFPGRKDKKKKSGKKPDGAFVGTDAVDFLVGSGLAESRVEAVDLGRTLAREFNLFEHCDQEHEFEDEEFFYSFCYEGEIRPMDEIEMDISRLMVIAKDFEVSVKVKENKFRLRKYKKTFLGCDAVDYLVDSCTASSRKEAVQIGRAITKEFSLFEHVTNDRKFEDSNIPYFFVNDSQRYKGLNLEKKRARRNIFAQSDDDESVSSKDMMGSSSHHSANLKGDFNFSFNTEDTEWAKKMATFERKMHATASGPLAFPKVLAEGDDESSQSSSEVRKEKMENRFMEWASKFHRLDPRYQIRYFFDFVAQDGAENAETNVMDVDNLRPLYNFLPTRAQVFSVWRPTSADAIRKMMLGEAVGKGLDIKGKSAKRGKLSGFVPFLQIGENKHKSKIRTPSKEGVVRIFYPGDSRRGRDIAAEKLERVGLEMIETVEGAKEVLNDNNASKSARKDALDAMLLDLGPDPSITYIDDYAPDRYGLEIPERLFWEAFFVRQDCTRKPGTEYDTGRPSQPAFQDMNFAAIRAEPKENAPRAVVYQGADVDSPMNPFELLVAYEEEGRVMPVVSDFDCFLVGTKRVKFTSPLAKDQLKVLKWYVGEIESVMKTSKVGDSWTVNWLEILKKAARDGFYPEMPRFGFGDPKSYSIMKNAVSRLSHSGAVRHGAECFNYYFPQDLDDEFLVIANDLPDGKPWAYVDVEGLQDILEEKIEQGFTFPLNPKWVLCDAFRWYDLYTKLLNSDKEETKQSMNCWFPPDSGLRDLIERVHGSRPDGFYQGEKDGDADDDSSSEGGIGLGGGGDAKDTMMSTVVAIRLLEKFQARTKKYQSSGGESADSDSE